MAKTDMLCPFNNKLCAECALYRGRHYYLSLCKQYRGYIAKPKAKAKSDNQHLSDFEALKKAVEPWADAPSQPETEPKIRLKVIDMETGQSRVCEPAKAKTWDWGDPSIMRVVDGAQVATWHRLVAILRYKAEKGEQEVKLYEAPRFMLLAGG